MTICFFHSGITLYGSDRILLALVKGAVSAGHHAHVYLPGDGPLVAKLEGIPGVTLATFPMAGFPAVHRPCHIEDPLGHARYALKGLDFLRSLMWIFHELGRVRPDLVHTNSISLVPVALAATARRLPHLWHVHDVLARRRVAGRVLAHLAGLLSSETIAVSDAVKRQLVSYAPHLEDHVIVIRNGIDPAPYDVAAPGEFRRELGLTPQDVLVGMIGRVTPEKGQDFFLDAIRLIGRRPGLHFAMVGGGSRGNQELVEGLRERARGLEHVHIIDFREDVAGIHAAFDVFVLPTLWPDAFPTVVLEAMAAARPVIATDQGGPPEMVIEGETGFLVAPGDVAALADRILRLALDGSVRAAFGAHGRERLGRQFLLSRFVGDFLERCESAASKRR